MGPYFGSLAYNIYIYIYLTVIILLHNNYLITNNKADKNHHHHHHHSNVSKGPYFGSRKQTGPRVRDHTQVPTLEFQGDWLGRVYG